MTRYLDHQATTPMSARAREIYADALAVVGNPSSIHQAGQVARDMLERARSELAALLGVDPIEVIFTSGGTESINTWIKGRVFAHRGASPDQPPPVIVLSTAEHHATLDAVAWLEKMGLAKAAWVDVDAEGRMDLQSLEDTLARTPIETIAGVTSLVANNEVGTIQPIAAMLEGVRSVGPIPVHLDAIQAFGIIPLDLASWKVDALSITAHKVGGPVGVGALIVSRFAAPIEPLLHGGSQQTLRSGTLDAAGAVAFAYAAGEALGMLDARAKQMSALRDQLISRVTSAVPGVTLRGSATERLPHNAHFTVEGAEGETLLYLLDQRSIAVSTGSACQSGVAEPSHVLLAMGLSANQAKGALRISLGAETTIDDVDAFVHAFPEVVARARAASA